MAKGKRKPAINRPASTVLTATPGIEQTAGIAVGTPESNAALSVYYQLQESEWWSPEVLAQQQWQQIQALVAAAVNTRHYAPILGRIGYDPRAPLHEDVWAAMPLLSRKTLQADPAALLNDKLPESFAGTSLVRTSGSTGVPVEVQWPLLLGQYYHAATIREQMWHRRDLNGRYAYLRIFRDEPDTRKPPGAKAPGWSALDRVVATGGMSYALDLHVSLDDQIRWLESIDPHYLATYPSNLKALLGRAGARGKALRLPSLREVRTMSETVDDKLRLLVKDCLNVPLVDAYSTQEMGHIAFQCPDAAEPVYHCQSEFVKVEVINAAGQACTPGETGRVVLTHLHNLRMPLIRYDIGDYAELGPPCSCGRGLPVLKKVLGRSRNMLSYPDGRRRWPIAGDGRYREIAPIVQYQFVQTEPDHLAVNLVAERPLNAAETEAFTRWVQERLDYPFRLTLNYFSDIPRHASGKFEDFRNELPDPD